MSGLAKSAQLSNYRPNYSGPLFCHFVVSSPIIKYPHYMLNYGWNIADTMKNLKQSYNHIVKIPIYQFLHWNWKYNITISFFLCSQYRTSSIGLFLLRRWDISLIFYDHKSYHQVKSKKKMWPSVMMLSSTQEFNRLSDAFYMPYKC